MVSHKFTASVRLKYPGLRRSQYKSSERWRMWPDPQDDRIVWLEFWAYDPPSALMRLHFVVQRFGRGEKKKNEKGIFRYGPADYTLQTMRSENGDYDLPQSPNPDFTTVESRRRYIGKERERITPVDLFL